MLAAIHARYSSENQRPESIEDQVAACRRFAGQRGFTIVEDHIYSDQAQSGARKDRQGLAALLSSAASGQFQVVLVDDLSRLARDNYLMLSVLAELHFAGVRVVSVADGLDSHDQEATLGIQIRGIFNELQLRDLKNKTLRGQIGQKRRGFSVGEHAYGYRSVAVGATRLDKKGRPRPEGYKMQIDPREAAIVLRIFGAYADGLSLIRIVRLLNEENIPGRFRSRQGWAPATVGRMLDNDKYIGHWVWNKTERRRDPRTGQRKCFAKPEAEWVIQEDESLRIVPQELWEQVRARRKEVCRSWPGGTGQRGFSAQQGGRERCFPTHLLSGAMFCGKCGATIAQVSGKGGGYYGCLGATKGACDNKLLVRRSLVEKIILDTVLERLSDPTHIEYVLRRVEVEVAKLYTHVPESIHLKEVELTAEERRLANFVDFNRRGPRQPHAGSSVVERQGLGLAQQLLPPFSLEESRANSLVQPDRSGRRLQACARLKVLLHFLPRLEPTSHCPILRRKR
jgi:site-specific DNA recombinase